MPRSHLHPHSPDPALSSRTFPTVTLILVILALLALVAGAVGYALPLLNIFFQPRIRTRTRTVLCPTLPLTTELPQSLGALIALIDLCLANISFPPWLFVSGVGQN